MKHLWNVGGVLTHIFGWLIQLRGLVKTISLNCICFESKRDFLTWAESAYHWAHSVHSQNAIEQWTKCEECKCSRMMISVMTKYDTPNSEPILMIYKLLLFCFFHLLLSKQFCTYSNNGDAFLLFGGMGKHSKQKAEVKRKRRSKKKTQQIIIICSKVEIKTTSRFAWGENRTTAPQRRSDLFANVSNLILLTGFTFLQSSHLCAFDVTIEREWCSFVSAKFHTEAI